MTHEDKPCHCDEFCELVSQPNVNPELKIQVKEALEAIKGRSFSGRHPELGKMIKCRVCGRRHRSVQELRTHLSTVKDNAKLVGYVTCTTKFAVTYVTEALNEETGEFEVIRDEPLQKDTLKALVGAAAFKGKRKASHANARNLQLVELTQTLFPKYEPHFETPREAMFAARKEAAAFLKLQRRADLNLKRNDQYHSRRINLGFEAPGTRA